jgi:hypothetical protein
MRWLAAIIAALALSCAASGARAQGVSGNAACPGSGTILTNTGTANSSLFLVLQTEQVAADPLANVVLTWFDPARGKLGAVIGKQASEAVALTMKAGTALAYSCGGTEDIFWSILNGAAANSFVFGSFTCDQGIYAASGALLLNHLATPLDILLSVSSTSLNGPPIAVTLSWKDAGNKARTESLVNQTSRGLSLTLGAGDGIAYKCTAALTDGSVSFQVLP